MGHGRSSDVIFHQIDGMNDNFSIQVYKCVNAETLKVIDGQHVMYSYTQATEGKNKFYTIYNCMNLGMPYVLPFLNNNVFHITV